MCVCARMCIVLSHIRACVVLCIQAVLPTALSTTGSLMYLPFSCIGNNHGRGPAERR